MLEIDDPHDLARARALAPLLDADRAGALPTADDIDAVVLDFDGTQTDDRVLIDSDGQESVSVHRGDGLGIAALRRAGPADADPVHGDRTRSSPPAPASCGVPVLHGVDRKDLALKQWCEEQGIAPERVLYVGNDVNDLPCFALVGWPVAVAERPRRRTRRRPRGHHRPRRRRRGPRDRRLAPRPLPRLPRPQLRNVPP